jgi:hypothetical protein
MKDVLLRKLSALNPEKGRKTTSKVASPLGAIV